LPVFFNRDRFIRQNFRPVNRRGVAHRKIFPCTQTHPRFAELELRPLVTVVLGVGGAEFRGELQTTGRVFRCVAAEGVAGRAIFCLQPN
jgi:hypothetical protein